MQQTQSEPIPRQQLGEGGLLALLALLSAFIPLSTDMYLPALPTMVEALHSQKELVNLTLVLFFLFYSLGTLLWGPLSDKYGRKPTLLCGLALYIVASIYCACAGNVYQLIIARVLQAIAGGASPAIATALVKDLFHGRKRERGLVLIQSMVMIAPIIAPLIGSLLLKFISWHGIFYTLAGFGVVALLWSLALRETVVERFDGSIFQTLGQLGAVLKNPGFTVLLIIFSLIISPLYTYLAASSYIYEKEFGLSELQYSYYFVCNAMSAVLAPFIYLFLTRHVKSYAIISGCFVMMIVSGALICTLGHLQPWVLALCIIPGTVTMGVIRPPSTHLLLEQQQFATGSASALIICAMSIVGSLGMLMMSWNWRSMIIPLGLVHVTAGVVSGALWLLLSRRPFIKHPTG